MNMFSWVIAICIAVGCLQAESRVQENLFPTSFASVSGQIYTNNKHAEQNSKETAREDDKIKWKTNDYIFPTLHQETKLENHQQEELEHNTHKASNEKRPNFATSYASVLSHVRGTEKHPEKIEQPSSVGTAIRLCDMYRHFYPSQFQYEEHYHHDHDDHDGHNDHKHHGHLTYVTDYGVEYLKYLKAKEHERIHYKSGKHHHKHHDKHEDENKHYGKHEDDTKHNYDHLDHYKHHKDDIYSNNQDKEHHHHNKDHDNKVDHHNKDHYSIKHVYDNKHTYDNQKHQEGSIKHDYHNEDEKDKDKKHSKGQDEKNFYQDEFVKHGDYYKHGEQQSLKHHDDKKHYEEAFVKHGDYYKHHNDGKHHDQHHHPIDKDKEDEEFLHSNYHGNKQYFKPESKLKQHHQESDVKTSSYYNKHIDSNDLTTYKDEDYKYKKEEHKFQESDKLHKYKLKHVHDNQDVDHEYDKGNLKSQSIPYNYLINIQHDDSHNSGNNKYTKQYQHNDENLNHHTNRKQPKTNHHQKGEVSESPSYNENHEHQSKSNKENTENVKEYKKPLVYQISYGHELKHDFKHQTNGHKKPSNYNKHYDNKLQSSDKYKTLQEEIVSSSESAYRPSINYKQENYDHKMKYNNEENQTYLNNSGDIYKPSYVKGTEKKKQQNKITGWDNIGIEDKKKDNKFDNYYGHFIHHDSLAPKGGKQPEVEIKLPETDDKKFKEYAIDLKMPYKNHETEQIIIYDAPQPTTYKVNEEQKDKNPFEQYIYVPVSPDKQTNYNYEYTVPNEGYKLLLAEQYKKQEQNIKNSIQFQPQLLKYNMETLNSDNKNKFGKTIYQFKYGIDDSRDGDVKAHRESGEKDSIEEKYKFAEPDGKIRTVLYSADELNGFNALVFRENGHTDVKSNNNT